MDEALATLAGNFSSSNQYFDLLVQVISPLGRAMAEMMMRNTRDPKGRDIAN